MNNWLLVQQFTILRYYSNIHSIIDILLCISSRFVWSGSQVLTLPPMYTRSVKAGSSTSGPSCASFPPFTSDLGEKCLLHQVNSAGKTWKQHGNSMETPEENLNMALSKYVRPPSPRTVTCNKHQQTTWRTIITTIDPDGVSHLLNIWNPEVCVEQSLEGERSLAAMTPIWSYMNMISTWSLGCCHKKGRPELEFLSILFSSGNMPHIC